MKFLNLVTIFTIDDNINEIGQALINFSKSINDNHKYELLGYEALNKQITDYCYKYYKSYWDNEDGCSYASFTKSDLKKALFKSVETSSDMYYQGKALIRIQKQLSGEPICYIQ